MNIRVKSDDRNDARYRTLGASIYPNPKKLKYDDIHKWKTRTLGQESFRENVKTVIMLLSSRGQECCETMTDLEKVMFDDDSLMSNDDSLYE